MNKFINIILFAFWLIVSGMVYQTFYRPAEIAPIAPNGTIVEIPMRSIANEWRFEPNVITAQAGDRVILKIFNEDSYDHGFALEAFGVNKRLFPNRETKIEFLVSKPGIFSFYCSVPCGEGHYRHVGQFGEITSPEEPDDHADDLTLACSINSACHRSLRGTLIVEPRG